MHFNPCRTICCLPIACGQEIDPAVLPAEFGGSHPDSGAAWFEEQLELEAQELQGPSHEAAEAEAAVAAPAAGGAAVEDVDAAEPWEGTGGTAAGSAAS